MCDKCAPLDKKIEHYEKIAVSIGDRVTVERLMALIDDLKAQKAVLHPEQSSKARLSWQIASCHRRWVPAAASS
jgi:hypothetical protein